MSTCEHEARGYVLAEMASFGAPGIDLVPANVADFTSLSRHCLNCDLEHRIFRVRVPPLLARVLPWNPHEVMATAQYKASALSSRPIWNGGRLYPVRCRAECRAEIPPYLHTPVDDDTIRGWTYRFSKREPPPQSRVAAPSRNCVPSSQTWNHVPKCRHNMRPLALPSPPGMRRAPQPRAFQYGSSRGSKGVTIQASSFESQPIFAQLVSSMTTHVDHARIEQEVAKYYRYATLSHKWEANEPLFEKVIHIAVYDLEQSCIHHKLQMFCKIGWDARLH